MKRPTQTSIRFDPPARIGAGRLTHYIVGGWTDYSQWIDPREVPLCDHDHGEVALDLMKQLVKRCLVPAHFARRCLASDWRDGHKAGAECLTYGPPSDGGRFDLWVERGET